jgi:hypothetical protein
MTVRDIVYIQLRRVHVKRFSVKNYVCLSFGCHQFRNTITFQGHAQQVNNKPGTQFSAFESFFGSFVFQATDMVQITDKETDESGTLL